MTTNPPPSAPLSIIVEQKPLYPSIVDREAADLLEYAKQKQAKIQNNADIIIGSLIDMIPKNHEEYLALIAIRKSRLSEKAKATAKIVKNFKKIFE